MFPPANSNNDMKPLSNGFVPGPMDVICAPGKTAFRHAGNHHYRKIIKMNLAEYSTAKSKLEKSFIVSFILQSIRDASSSGVGFVKKKNGRWLAVGDHTAREKIGQSFRDMLHSKYSSSSKAKKLRQKKSRETLDIPNSTGKVISVKENVLEDTGFNKTPSTSTESGKGIMKLVDSNPKATKMTNSPPPFSGHITPDNSDSESQETSSISSCNAVCMTTNEQLLHHKDELRLKVGEQITEPIPIDFICIL